MTPQNPSERRSERRSSERREADRALRECEERYRALFDSVDIVYLSDFEGRFLDANPAALELFGYEHREILALSLRSLLDDDQLAKASGVLADLKETGSQKEPIEFRLRRKTGQYVDVEIKVFVMFRDGLPHAVLGVGRDITERKRAEEALRSSENKFVKAFRASPNALAISRCADGLTIESNESWEQIFGYSREEVIGRSSLDLALFANPADWQSAVAQLQEQGFVRDFETEIRCKSDEARQVVLAMEPIEIDAEPCILTIVHDVTERRQAEQERLNLERRLQQSQRLESLGVLAGGIAHDFNNILMTVLGNAELALTGLSPSAPARENLLQITAGCRRAADLCRQMLAYSGRGHLVTETIDVRGLVEDMLDLLKTTISKKALLNLNMGKNLPPVRGDASQLSQVIMNLVINASEAIGEQSGVITISTGVMECTTRYLEETYGEKNLAPGLYLTLEVSDTGAGMDKATQERIFEPFFTTKFTGRGLGLSAVLGIARSHKGALRLYSELGKGTTFKILLPVSESAAEALGRANGAINDDWRGEGTVLLVDDEETIRALGARMLAALGFTVLAAADGREALALYTEHQDEISLVLLDLTMPHMDGEEAFRELRLIDPGVRVVMSSGYAETDISARFAGKGLVGFVHKPYSLAELRGQLLTALTPRPSP